MGIQTDDFGCLLVGLGVLIIVGSLIVFGIPLSQELRDAKTDRLNAEAALQQARADTERAKGEAEAMVVKANADRDHQEAVDWRREFETYTITLAAFLDGGEVLLVIISALLGVVVGGLAITALSRWKPL